MKENSRRRRIEGKWNSKKTRSAAAANLTKKKLTKGGAWKCVAQPQLPLLTQWRPSKRKHLKRNEEVMKSRKCEMKSKAMKRKYNETISYHSAAREKYCLWSQCLKISGAKREAAFLTAVQKCLSISVSEKAAEEADLEKIIGMAAAALSEMKESIALAAASAASERRLSKASAWRKLASANRNEMRSNENMKRRNLKTQAAKWRTRRNSARIRRRRKRRSETVNEIGVK